MKKYLSLLCILLTSFAATNAQQITFTPQWTPQSQFAGYYAALELGYYAQAGLDVNITHPTKTYTSFNMLLDGSSDIITSELIQAVVATDNDIRLVNLLQTTQHSTLVLLAREKGIIRISQLAGCIN